MTFDHVIMLAMAMLILAAIIDAAIGATRRHCWNGASFSTTTFPDRLSPEIHPQRQVAAARATTRHHVPQAA